MVLGQGFGLAMIGVALGVGLSLLFAPALADSFGSGAGTDPLVYIAVPLPLLAATGVACWAPARRAAKIAPWIAPRWE